MFDPLDYIITLYDFVPYIIDMTLKLLQFYEKKVDNLSYDDVYRLHYHMYIGNNDFFWEIYQDLH